MIKKKIILYFTILLSLNALGQQDAMYTHYMNNTLSVNPAYAGSRDALTATLLHRSQWVNFEGAPLTQTFTLHSPVLNYKIGLGLSVINDKIGPTNTSAFFIDYAYRVRLSKKSKLGFGIKAGLNLVSANLSSLHIDQPDDPSFSRNIENLTTPNFGFGLYYSRERFYAGISTPRLLENTYKYVKTADARSIAREQRHFFFIAGSMIKISDNIDLKPTTCIKATESAPLEMNLTASFVFNQRFLLGGMYRSGDAVGIIAGLNINEQLHIGYSFDWSFLNTTGRYNYGSHEILMTYDFIFGDKKKIRSPRYF